MSEQTDSGQLGPDDENRKLSLVDPDDPALQHVGVVTDTYTILLTGADTAGRYALLDMLVPPGGGPPLHRHDFEEMFHVMDGEIVVTFRDETVTAKTGTTVNIPALAPHHFTNKSDRPARLLCMVSPPGLDQYFAAFGVPLPSRTAPAPKQSGDELQKALADAQPLAHRYRIQNLPPQ